METEKNGCHPQKVANLRMAANFHPAWSGGPTVVAYGSGGAAPQRHQALAEGVAGACAIAAWSGGAWGGAPFRSRHQATAGGRYFAKTG